MYGPDTSYTTEGEEHVGWSLHVRNIINTMLQQFEQEILFVSIARNIPNKGRILGLRGGTTLVPMYKVYPTESSVLSSTVVTDDPHPLL